MNLCQKLAAYFHAHPNEWIDGRVLHDLAGFAGWSARVRDLRKPPYRWTIENQTTRHEFMGRKWTETKYRYTVQETSHENTAAPTAHV